MCSDAEPGEGPSASTRCACKLLSAGRRPHHSAKAAAVVRSRCESTATPRSAGRKLQSRAAPGRAS
eukprot:3170233-Alexandrium_andersonii.AAC.1